MAIAPDIEHKEVGIRPGEKIHEEMITASDSFNTFDLGKYYVILPTVPNWNLEEFLKEYNGKRVPSGFSYNSGDNTEWVGINELRQLIIEHVDPAFSI